MIKQLEGFKQKLIFNCVSKDMKRERGLVQVNDVNADFCFAIFKKYHFCSTIF